MSQLPLDLPGRQAPPRHDRVFFALVPDQLTARRIYQLAKGIFSARGLTGPLIPPERLHVSLFSLDFPFSGPDDLVAAAEDAAARVSEQPFEVTFDTISSFGGGAVVLRGSNNVPEICRFWESLGFAMEATPLAPYALAAARRALSPHITMLYDDAGMKEQEVFPIRWVVRDFVLIRSHVGQGRHTHLGRWQL